MGRRAATVAALLIASVLACLGVVLTGQDDRGNAEILARRADARLAALQSEASALASRERSLLGDLRRLEIERDVRIEEFQQGERELARLNAGLDDISAHIAELEPRVSAQQHDVSTRAVELYKLGQAGYVRLLLDVDDLRAMGRAYRLVSALEAIDRQRVREHEATMTRLRQNQTALATRRARRVVVQQAMVVSRDASVRAATALAALIDDIDARRDLNARFTGELQQAYQDLQRTVDDLARGASGPAPTVVALPLRPFQGDLDWPVTGAVMTRFGRQSNRHFQTAIASNGVLLAAAAETAVRAIHDGTVAYAAPFTGFGNLVILDHGESAYTMYGHLAGIGVTAGARVRQGQTLGETGVTLDGTPALYFELRIDGRPVDPLQWLRKR
jgi:septal ring factor EnvC (AmiA/AmiB activator)